MWLNMDLQTISVTTEWVVLLGSHDDEYLSVKGKRVGIDRQKVTKRENIEEQKMWWGVKWWGETKKTDYLHKNGFGVK